MKEFLKYLIPALFWFLVFMLVSSLAYAQTAIAEWDPNTESDLLGYRVYMAETPYMSVPFEDPDGLGSITTTATEYYLYQEDENLYIWLTAVDTSLNESGVSDFVRYSRPPPMPTGVNLFTLYLKEEDLWNEA